MNIDVKALGDAVFSMVRECAVELRPDVVAAFERAEKTERGEQARAILGQLLENARIAREKKAPICQDTGTVWVLLELGPDAVLVGDVQKAVDEAVERAYTEGNLRMSVVRDALVDRTNTGTNTPAFVDIVPSTRPGARVSVMLKGAGSDNASRVFMLDPAAGFAGIEEHVLALVQEKASMACPPLIVGIGVGATFDHVGGLAKRALLRSVDTPHSDERVAAIEQQLLTAINATGVGPGGLGGDTTALSVHIESAPCHIAALPLAVNMGCSAMRSRTSELY